MKGKGPPPPPAGTSISVTITGATGASPQSISVLGKQQATITWSLTSGLTWSSTSAGITFTAKGMGNLTSGFTGSSSPSQYFIAYTNNAATTISIPYTANVTASGTTPPYDGDVVEGGNDPVIENQGGGGRYYLGRD
jgi:hypothetical protein